MKPTKLESLNEALASARAALAHGERTTGKELAAEHARIEELREVYNQACEKQRAAYDQLRAITKQVRARLFPPDAIAKLEADVAALASTSGLPHADVPRLVRDFVSNVIHADPPVRDATAAHAKASAEEQKAYRAWNVATSNGPIVRLARRMRDLRENVERIEKEIERLPRYRSAAKDRRAEAKLEELRAAQTIALREIMDRQLKWNGETVETGGEAP